jgi:hypothetical protein
LVTRLVRAAFMISGMLSIMAEKSWKNLLAV